LQRIHPTSSIMATVKELEKEFKTARKAWRANKEDKKLKKAFKAAKAAFEAASEGDAEKTPSKKRKAESEDESSAKKAKTDGADLSALEKAMKKARKAKKAEASPANKKAFKAAKKALEDAKAAAAPSEEAAEEATEEAAEEATEEATEEAAPAASPMDSLAGLKKGGAKPAATDDGKEPTARLFCGNLSWNIEEDGIKEFFSEAGNINDIYWAEDRDTGKFKGFGFITFDTVEMAIKAMEKNGMDLFGRPVKLDYSTPRVQKKGKGKGGKGRRQELSEKPEGCTTVFCGGLTDNVDDDKMAELATGAGCGEIKAIRWLTDRETGNFKGCGFVEFYSGEDVDSFVKLNGSEFMGRNLRLDYSAPRKPKAW